MGQNICSHPELQALESTSKNKNFYEEFLKIVYAAILQDRNNICYLEVLTDIDSLVIYFNNEIEIVKELYRHKDLEILKRRILK